MAPDRKTYHYLYESIKTGQQQNGFGISLKTLDLHCDTDVGRGCKNLTRK
jgi:hypothetical protein